VACCEEGNFGPIKNEAAKRAQPGSRAKSEPTAQSFTQALRKREGDFGLRRQAERDAALDPATFTVFIPKALSPLRSSLRCASPRQAASAVQKLPPV